MRHIDNNYAAKAAPTKPLWDVLNDNLFPERRVCKNRRGVLHTPIYPISRLLINDCNRACLKGRMQYAPTVSPKRYLAMLDG